MVCVPFSGCVYVPFTTRVTHWGKEESYLLFSLQWGAFYLQICPTANAEFLDFPPGWAALCLTSHELMGELQSF